MNGSDSYQGPAFFSYGFRPFFLSAALFAGIAVPLWVLLLAGVDAMEGALFPRDWHVHEMIFGFLPGVVTGFLLTAIPNWTGRSPVRGNPLMGLLILWIAGRVTMASPWSIPVVTAIVDGAFLFVVAGFVWREIIAGNAWERMPMGMLISLYASANILFHTLVLTDSDTDVAERMALGLVMILLALVGGRVTPSFTEDYFVEQGVGKQPPSFSRFDGLSIGFVGLAAIVWIMEPHTSVTGWAFVVAGLMNLVRLGRWQGWFTWREPLVLVLHIGYGWLAFALLILGGAILGIGPAIKDAVHALTTGAVGVMTVAVMTRASLGHTGRVKHAGFITICIYLLINLGAIFRVFGAELHLPNMMNLSLAAFCWSGGYLLFVAGYGRMLFGQNLDES